VAIPFHSQKSLAAVFLAALPAPVQAAEPANAPALLDLAVDTLGGRMVEIWKTPLFTLSDPVYENGQLLQRASSVTFGMLVTALAILLVGGVISAAVGRWLRLRVSKRLDLDPTTGAILQKFTNYTLLFLVSLVALSAVNIPLTIFALLGGAAAIAVGFGAQQLANNLISGLILLFERPIRIGDLVEVGTYTGTVASIGTRCCQLHRDDGVEILIPNSVILQGTVVNHTLRSQASRLEMSVTISANAPIEQAMRILREVAAAHTEINTQQGIDAHVQDIGPNSVKVLLSFWSEAKTPLAIAKIQSDLRLATLRHFQSENISLA
jgi:small-conductance mechanosensitive channel